MAQAAEIREIADKAGREKERALVRDAANYLFDQGLEVLTELAMARSGTTWLGRRC